ncbi:tektin bundle-interacting protein 1 [Malaclemys terrapin pileata]|uniref:tektin bundle-interacting protein 1 n=1 Tax=Malaclemys terrapin pileata TaxID=2991368 RepID=UPI0023A8608B|nr:tektin bundle-interacting protein 1 [Malaclemys terrapin pileata]
MDLEADRPYVPQGTLETDFPTPLYSDEYLTLRGPRNAPVLKQAVRWKCTPMGRDAIPQTWYTGLTNSDNRDVWYTLTSGLSREAYHRWARSLAKRERKTLPPAYAQHLREGSWFDPVVPAQYLEPSTRWGAFLWKDKPVLGKEYVVNRNRASSELKGHAGYVPCLAAHTPAFTTRDFRTWTLFSHQPSTNQ